jgi:hypothetical protein
MSGVVRVMDLGQNFFETVRRQTASVKPSRLQNV